MVPRILIYEPDSSLAASYKEQLDKHHFWVVSLSDPSAALSLIEKQFFHLCIWPIEDESQTEVIFKVKRLRPETAVLISSLRTDPSLVVACMRAGASHFWVKHPEMPDLLETVNSVLSRTLPQSVDSEDSDATFAELTGKHPSMKEIFKLISQIKDADSTILITGESGTGKELVSRALHFMSHRKREPWVAVNCSAIPANLIESELFGHVKGAFTGASQNRIGRFQMAGSGTLFLDEIGELSLDLQAKLLRVIQNKVFEPVGSPHSIRLNARIVTATNQNLETAVSERRFREDLFYRLNVIPIFMPPLRGRKSDTPLLVHRFLERHNTISQKNISGISEEAMQCLMQYHWPGNIRELENLIERVVVLKEGSGVLELKDFPVGYFRNVKLDRFIANIDFPDEGLNFNDAVNEFENELILQALRNTAGNKNKAAHLLNLNRTTLVEKLKRKGLRIIS